MKIDLTGEPLPVRMLNEYAYCSRLFHLMYVDGRWDDNLYTEEGKAAHARTDARDEPLPEPAATEGDPPPVVARSVMLSSETLGIVAKLDLVEAAGTDAVPVDTKRGKPPDTPERCWEPERIQLMAQGLLLREHGFGCVQGMLYFAAARKRVVVPLTPDLEARTLHLIQQARLLMESQALPEPLQDSPKCNGCSLAGICLPDEVNFLKGRSNAQPGDLRRLYPARDDALPLYVQEQGAKVGKTGESVTVSKGGTEIGRYLLKDVSQVGLYGNVSMTPQALHLLAEKGIPVTHLSMGGWFYAVTRGHGLKNAYDRAAQFRTAEDHGRCLAFAKAVVDAKSRNQRTLLRRNGSEGAGDALDTMASLVPRINTMSSTEQLLGLEGSLSAAYFSQWSSMIKEPRLAEGFAFNDRNRRPPRDPINAMLSFGYALLCKECTVAIMTEGLDPWWGLYHRPRHGRPALALDCMEEFRPLLVDSAVLNAVNMQMVAPGDFVTASSGCMMQPSARKALIRAFEMRLDQLITHPVFDYRCSWRAVIRLQVKLLAKWLRGETESYTGITTR
ncbi:MAG: CRISPR-associated endonuclease Cas1 [Kiritimatiellia bacterium]